jgi:uncharacterized protein (TIGR03066 family)
MRCLTPCLVCLVCLLITSCGPKTNSKELIIGKWTGTNRDTKSALTMDFTKDGKVTYEARGATMPGTYTWTDNDHVETDLTLPSGKSFKEKNKVTIATDKLTLANEQGTTLDFTRAR